MVTEEQRKFMLDEFGLTGEQINKLSDKEYDQLFNDVLCIEGEENYKCEGKTLSKRGRIAGEILSIMYY